jgi:hypothetical protein
MCSGWIFRSVLSNTTVLPLTMSTAPTLRRVAPLLLTRSKSIISSSVFLSGDVS